MPHRSSRPYLAAIVLLLSACATAPTPPPPASPASPQPKPLALFCGASANDVAFKSLNLPIGEEPVDVALTPRHVWVLFQPARLLRFERAAGPVHVETSLGPPGEVWTGIDADPVDGSIWSVSEEFVFHNIASDLTVKTIPLKRQVQGKSGFARLLVAPDALYAAPICGDYGVWRIERTGKVLGTAFPIEHAKDEVLDPDTMECAHAEIERDREGRILARDKAGKVFRADLSGAWEPIETDLLRAARAHTVRATQFGKKGRPGEYYYAAGYQESLFFWKGRPVFLGSPDVEAVHLAFATTFYLTDPTAGPEAGALKRLAAQCGRETILDVATDGTGYAAITQGHLFFGDFANAPDLP